MECDWIVFILSVLMKLLPTRGIQLNECNSSGWIQVEEGSQNISLLTCSGLKSTDRVTWNLNVQTIGICETGPDNCSTYHSLFKIERPENEYSKLSLVRSATKLELDARNISCSVTKEDERICAIDYIIRAKEIACNANFKPDTWNVTSACNISNFYSTQRNYTCVWKEWINDTPTQIESRFVNWEIHDNRATCEMNKPLPDKDGEYNYTMKFSPVTEYINAQFLINNSIYKPKYRPTMNCTNSTYIVEGQELVCTCYASDLGQPPGRLFLHWNNSVIHGNYGVRSVLQRFDRVTRQHNGNILRCALDWASMYTGELNVSYTFNVAYGPDNMSVLGPVDFEVHPYLTRQLSLGCVHSDAKPYVTYLWSGCCTNQMNNYCNFTPTVANDGQTVICTLFNSLAGVTKNASFQLTLQYPPPNPPEITGYLGEPLYSDQPKTIFCNVSGGKPPVHNVTFNCQGQSYTNNGQGISIQLIPNATYNGKSCTCRSFWKHPDWYDATATITLLIYSSKNDGDSSTTAAIAGGVCSAIIVIAIIVFVLVLLKRHERGNSNDTKVLSNENNPNSSTHTDNGADILNELYASAGNVDDTNLLSKKCIKEQQTVYANVAFRQDTEKNAKHSTENSEKEATFVYTTIEFSQAHAKPAECILQNLERTEYASIDFKRSQKLSD